MPVRLPPLNSLKAFEAAARNLSVKRAAIELNVTSAAVSHQIRALEEYLGVQLFRRYNRALELTDVAKAALPKLGEGFDCMAQAVTILRSQQNGGSLTVSAAPSFASRWLMPRLHRFIAAHPEIDVRISARMRRVTDWLADSDVAILYGRGHVSGIMVERLLDLSITPICSPKLLTGEHPLKTAEDLKHHLLLHDDTGELYDTEPFWGLWLREAGVTGVEANKGPHFSHAVLAFEAAIDAVGVLVSMPALAAEDIASGKLVAPFDLTVKLPDGYYMACSEHADERPAVAAFRAWLREEAARSQRAERAAAAGV